MRQKSANCPSNLKKAMAQTMIVIDKQSDRPIYQQIYLALREQITEGELAPGQKLPSIRALAGQLGIARNTVDSAYRQLQVEGYVDSRQGSGFIVQDTVLHRLNTKPEDSKPDKSKQNYAPETAANRIKFDFRYGNLCTGSFPAEQWRRLINDVLADDAALEMASYNNPKGEYGLRAAIARHLHDACGVDCEPEQIIMTSGTQQSIELLCRMFDPHSDRIAMENPGYYYGRAIFESLGYAIDPIQSDCGAEQYLGDIERSKAKLIYTTPCHQFPVGFCMDMQTRALLLLKADEKDAFIIEDNYDSEFRYNSQPIPSLQSIDQWGRVIYLGTFSKVLSPALRMSYVVLPPQLLELHREQFEGCRCSVPWLEQETMRRFMAQGLWKKHLHRAMLANRKHHDLLVQTIRDTFDPEHVRMYAGDAGLFVLLDVDNGMSQAELIASAAASEIGISSTKNLWIDNTMAPERLVLIGYSAADTDAIKKGIPLLRKAWF